MCLTEHVQGDGSRLWDRYLSDWLYVPVTHVYIPRTTQPVVQRMTLSCHDCRIRAMRQRRWSKLVLIHKHNVRDAENTRDIQRALALGQRRVYTDRVGSAPGFNFPSHGSECSFPFYPFPQKPTDQARKKCNPIPLSREQLAVKYQWRPAP